MNDWREWAILVTYLGSAIIAAIFASFIPSLKPWETWIQSILAALSVLVYFIYVQPAVEQKRRKRDREVEEYMRQKRDQ